MENYLSFNFKQSMKQSDDGSTYSRDPISFDRLESSDKENSHIRGTMSLRRSNGIPYYYNVDTVLDIINKGDGKDPFTRIPFSSLVKERAKLYKESKLLFPNYTYKNLNVKDLFERWKKYITSSENEQKENFEENRKLNIEAKCFLQAEDLTSIFRKYNGKENLENRPMSERELKNKKDGSWLIRNSSIKGNEHNKAYVFTYKSRYNSLDEKGIVVYGNPKYTHILIVHKIGEGFFCNVELNRGVDITNDIKFGQSYPTIISLLEKLILNR
jgi:hypothetical protein